MNKTEYKKNDKKMYHCSGWKVYGKRKINDMVDRYVLFEMKMLGKKKFTV